MIRCIYSDIWYYPKDNLEQIAIKLMQDWANTKEISKQKTLIRILKKVTNFINSPNRSILIVDKSLYSEFAKTYRNSSTHTFIKVNIK